jgi:hypothetical protein
MTLWTVHVQRPQLEVGAQLNFFPNGLEEAEAVPMLALGDALELELPNGTPFRGVLVSADAEQVIMEIGDTRWNIRPATETDNPSPVAKGMPCKAWIIGAKVPG